MTMAITHRAERKPFLTCNASGRFGTRFVLLAFGLLWLTTTPALVAAPNGAAPNGAANVQDWLYWRGPNYDGSSSATHLIDTFNPLGGAGSNVAWKRDDLGGRSTPVIMNGKLFTLCRAMPGTPEEGERVVCVDAKPGETRWENRFNVYLSDVPDTRVGWSAVVADKETNSVYSLGVCGVFQCIDADSGETRWSIPMHEQFGLLSTYGGRTNFPIVDGDLVIVSAVFINWGDYAKPAHTMIAFDKRNGQVVWMKGTRIGPYDTTYSGPSLARINGQSTLVFGSGDGAIWAFQPQTGRPLWKVDLSRRGINANPLVVGDRVYACQSEENVDGSTMGAVVAIDATKAKSAKPVDSFAKATDLTKTGVLWKVEELMSGRSQPLLVNDQLWVFDDRAKLWILNAETGEPIGERIRLGSMMRASMLYSDGKVYAFEANGRWAIYRPDADLGAAVVSNGRLPAGEEVNGAPSVAMGSVFFQSTGGLYCLRNPSTAPSGAAVANAKTTVEPSVTAGPVAFVQVVPAEVLVKPGTTQTFEARLFDEQGRFIRKASDASFSVSGVGQISSNGEFTAVGNDHVAASIVAHVGDLQGTARVRIVPGLPWNFNFDDGNVPVTWVGARYRHVALDDDLLGKLNHRNAMAGQLYIYLQSAFVNSGIPRQVFDNSTPQQKLADLQRFLGIRTTRLDEAKSLVDPALEVLIEEEVLASRDWTELPNAGGIQLTVQQGNRASRGNGVMTKITTIPKGTRSRCWFGHSDLANYTIQADVRAARKDNKMPDIGLIAQGYAIDLQGANQKIQIRTWVPQLRMAQSVDFPWSPDTWYTVKFQSALQDDQIVLRGKVWPRDTLEPTAWTLEAIDKSPVVSGSPGLFGNAKDAEIFLDNVQVTAN